MGFFSKLFGGGKKSNASSDSTAYGFVSEDGGGISHDKAKELRDQFLATVEQNDKSKAMNLASKLLLNKAYEDAIDAFEMISEKYPDELGTCQSQIGAAKFFQGNYEEAIENYVAARDNGMHAAMMDDNIWEACEKIHSDTGDKAAIERYLELCPDGSYAKRAHKILG